MDEGDGCAALAMTVGVREMASRSLHWARRTCSPWQQTGVVASPRRGRSTPPCGWGRWLR